MAPGGVNVGSRPHCAARVQSGVLMSLLGEARRLAEPIGQSLRAAVAWFARPRPIRVHLCALVIGVALPLLAFAAVALWRVAAAERRLYEQQLRHTANDLADDLDRAIDGMFVTLRSLSTSTNLQKGDFKQFHAQATTALSGSPFGLILIDPSFQQVVNTLVPFGTPLPRSGDSETPTRVLKSKQPEVSNLFVGALLKRPFLNVDVPVLVNGEVRYILLLTFEPDYIYRILLGQNLPPGLVTGVSDAHGRVIARSAEHEKFLNTSLPDDLFDRRDDDTVFQAKNLKGEPILRAVARLRHADWMTAATVPMSQVSAASRSAYWTLGILGLSALALSLTVAAGLGRLLSRSVLRLVEASRAIKGAAPVVLQPMVLAEAVTVQAALREAYQTRRRIEEELRLAAERLALAARIAGVAHATVTYGDDGTSVVHVSPELSTLLGIPAGDLSGDLASALVHPDDRQDIQARFAAAIGPGGDGQFQAEHRVLKADGKIAWLNVRSTTLFAGDALNRRPRLTVVAVRDITARKQNEDALLASEARYRAAMLVGRIASWETNLATRVRTWTPEGKHLFGLTLPGLLGRVGGPDDEYRNALHPDDRHLMARFHGLAEDNDGFGAEYRIRHPDGTLLWVSGRGQVVERGTDGKPIRLLNVVADITERKLAEDALKISETRFRMLAEAIPNIAWTATTDGVVDWQGSRWGDYIGAEPHAAPEQGALRRVHVDDREKTLTAWRAAVANRQPYEIEHRLRGKDGVYRWFLNRAMPIRNPGNEVIAWIGTATNIDALKTTEARLARYVAVADAAYDGLISVTPEGVIESWNSGAERLLGYKAAEVLGQPTAMLIPEEALAAHLDMLATVRRGGIVGPIDVRRRHKEGHIIDVAISMTGVKDAHGDLIAIAKVAHDISERIEAERRQLLLNRELVHRVKNTFAVLQSVMRATLRSSPSLKAFAATFTGRVESMSAAHDLLTAREWRDAELRALAQRQLAPLVDAGRIAITGPTIELPAAFAVPLGLLLHELATNAVKYGALSVPQGRVTLSWAVNSDGTRTHIKISWLEQGGPAVLEPTRRGFGSFLIEQGLPDAKVAREFRPDGVACTIILPLQALDQHG